VKGVGRIPSTAREPAAAGSREERTASYRDDGGQLEDGSRLILVPGRMRHHADVLSAKAHLAVVLTLALAKVMLPEPPPASTRIRASYILPRFMPMLAHCLKCSLIDTCPHVRGV